MSTQPSTTVTSWQDLPDHARVWIYQGNRTLTPSEEEMLLKKGKEFVSGWASHGQEMTAAFEVFHNRFAVIMADENKAMASGCSIDSSVHFIQQIQQEIGIDFFDRMRLVYKVDGDFHDCTLAEIPALVTAGQVTPDTLMFDNLVAVKSDFAKSWPRPMSDTWAARYF